MTKDPSDAPKPLIISRQAIGAGDVVITADEMDGLINSGEFTSPEDFRAKLFGNLGVRGANVDPDAEAKLLPYSPEQDGPLGVMDHTEFDEALGSLDAESPAAATAERKNKIWEALTDVSIDSAQMINDWNNPDKLKVRLGELQNRILAVEIGAGTRDPNSPSIKELYNLRAQITGKLRLNRAEDGVPPSAPGPVIGRPFMVVKVSETGHIDERDEMASSGKMSVLDDQPFTREVFMDLDALYDFLVVTEDSVIGNLGSIRPQIVNMVNSRIMTSREGRS
jgi:hypothetical protein